MERKDNGPEWDSDDCSDVKLGRVDSDNVSVGGFVVYVGQQLDVLDTCGRWSEAEVLKIDKQRMRMFVTYVYYSNEWDEHVGFAEFARRVAARHSYTYREGGEFQKGQRIELYGSAKNKPSSALHWKEAFVEDVAPTKVAVRMRNDEVVTWMLKATPHIRPFGPSKSLTRKTFNKQWDVPGSSSSSRVIRSRKREICAATTEFELYRSTLALFSLRIVEIPGDGNCLFRSVAHQVYGDDALHTLVREKCCDYMESEKAFFSNFVVGGLSFFDQYIHAKRTSSCWGDDPEIQAMCELYNRPAEIWAFDRAAGARKLRTFHSTDSQQVAAVPSMVSATGVPMRLSFYGGGHYDSIVGMEFEEALLSKADQGLAEDASIARRLRVGTDEAKAECLSDTEATDAATVAAVLRTSREEASAWEDDGGGDLEACLALSLNDHSVLGVGTCNSAPVTAESKTDDELSTIQDEMLQGAKNLSEQEYVDQAVAASMLDSASSAGPGASQMTEAEAFELALQQSMSDVGGVAPSSDFLVDEDDDLLQQALYASTQYK
jgi:OTU domain-containing protein 5